MGIGRPAIGPCLWTIRIYAIACRVALARYAAVLLAIRWPLAQSCNPLLPAQSAAEEEQQRQERSSEPFTGSAVEWVLRKADESLDEIEENPPEYAKVIYDISTGPIGEHHAAGHAASIDSRPDDPGGRRRTAVAVARYACPPVACGLLVPQADLSGCMPAFPAHFLLLDACLCLCVLLRCAGKAASTGVTTAAKVTVKVGAEAIKAAAPVGKWALQQGVKLAVGAVAKGISSAVSNGDSKKDGGSGKGKKK